MCKNLNPTKFVNAQSEEAADAWLSTADGIEDEGWLDEIEDFDLGIGNDDGEVLGP